jgi:hypothetical protein
MCILYNQRDATYAVFFIIITALHISGDFSSHLQELKNCMCSLGIVMLSCSLPPVWMVWFHKIPGQSTGKA